MRGAAGLVRFAWGLFGFLCCSCAASSAAAGRPTPHCGIGASSARARAASWPLGGAQRQHRSEYRAGRSQALRKRMARRRRPEECVLRGDEALRHGDGRSSTCRSTGFDLATPAAITLAACAQVRCCLCPSLLVPARPTPRSPRLPYHSRYQVVLCQSPSYTKTTRPPLTLRPNPIRSN